MHIYFNIGVLPDKSTKEHSDFYTHFVFTIKKSENAGSVPKKRIIHQIVTRELLFHLNSRELYRLNTFLGHEPLGKCFDLRSITMH
jgi:hypothetical protein